MSDPFAGPSKDDAALGRPVPEDNWHSDAIEWAGVLKTVAEAARHRPPRPPGRRG